MRADLGPYLADGVLAIAGLGLLHGLGLVRPGGRGALAALGLAYLTGVAAVGLIAVALLATGVPVSLPTILVVCALLTAAGVAAAWRRDGPPRRPERPSLPRLRGRSADFWFVTGFTGLFGGYAVAGFLSAMVTPLTGFDGWSIWSRKARMLLDASGLPTEFLESSAYAFTHPDYPLLYPVWQSIHFRAAAEIDTQMVQGHLWLLMVACIWALAYLMAPRVRAVIWGPILLAVAVAPGVWRQVLTGFADVPLGIFLVAGALLVGLWLAEGGRAHLALGALMLAAAASTKNEGLTTAVAVIAAAALTLAAGRRRAELRDLAVGAGAFVLVLLPWRIWIAAHDIESDLPIGDGLDPTFLADRTERVRPAVRALNLNLSDQGDWHYLLPVAVVVALACVAARAGARVALFYLTTAAVAWALLVWAYWISPYELGYHLRTSADRVVTGLMFLLVAAVLQLSGQLAALANTDSRRSPSTRQS